MSFRLAFNKLELPTGLVDLQWRPVCNMDCSDIVLEPSLVDIMGVQPLHIGDGYISGLGKLVAMVPLVNGHSVLLEGGY